MSIGGCGDVHNNRYIAAPTAPLAVVSNVASVPTFPVAPFHHKNDRTSREEESKQQKVVSNMATVQRRTNADHNDKNHKDKNHKNNMRDDHVNNKSPNHVTKANEVQTNKSTTTNVMADINPPTHTSTHRVVPLSGMTTIEKENKTSHQETPCVAIHKDDINIRYDVILGRTGVKVKDHAGGRIARKSDMGPPSPPDRTVKASASCDTTTHANTNPCDIDTTNSTGTSVSSSTLEQSMSIFDTTLVEWWEKYDWASHFDKHHIAMLCIDDMRRKGCRFLQMRDSGGTWDGYFNLVPANSDQLRRKVVRTLRKVVLQQLESFTEEQRLEHTKKGKEIRTYHGSYEFKQRIKALNELNQIESDASKSMKSTTTVDTKNRSE
jgi:hypothetical protein